MQRIRNGHAIKFPYVTLYTDQEYNAPGPLKRNLGLFVCDEDNPPKYKDDSGNDFPRWLELMCSRQAM